jgi:hypothetical protein
LDRGCVEAQPQHSSNLRKFPNDLAAQDFAIFIYFAGKRFFLSTAQPFCTILTYGLNAQTN